MTGIEPLSPTVKVGGSALPSQSLSNLVSIRVRRALRLPGRATLRFSDVGYVMSSSQVFKIGMAVELGIHDGGTLMTGTVTGMSLQQQEGDHPDLVVTVDDAAYKLTRGTQIKTYLQMSYSDIVSQIASQVGLTAAVDATTEVYPYVLQADTDLAFIDDLAERTGFDWWVEGRTLHFSAPAVADAALRLTLADDLHEFSVHATGLMPSAATVKGWDSSQQQTIVSTGSEPASGRLPTSTFVQPFLHTAGPLGAAPVTTGTMTPVSQHEASSVGDGLRAQWATGSVEARGTCEPSELLKPGVSVAVDQAGPTSGTYHVTEVEHRYDRRGFRSSFVAGDRSRTSLADILAPSQRSGSFNIPGLVVGVVTNINDPESSGRVKIKYSGISDDIEGPWARLVTLGAGNKRGLVFQPEVNDEVLVGFEGGDPRQPVILGGLYSAKNALPKWGVENSQVQSWRITSRTGHILEIADGTEPTAQHVMLQLKDTSHRIRLGSDRLDIEVASGKPISIKSGTASFEIDASNNVTIKGNKVTIEAQTELALKANTTLSATSQAQLNLQGGMVSVKGQGTASVEASGPLTLKGAMVAIN
ncbi:MAG: Rhs element Vgr protein [Frankiales bacterium]|nr:Rhs element Vgr protein [Frankiales bacterium]